MRWSYGDWMTDRVDIAHPPWVVCWPNTPFRRGDMFFDNELEARVWLANHRDHEKLELIRWVPDQGWVQLTREGEE